jgi:hypothetical protein
MCLSGEMGIGEYIAAKTLWFQGLPKPQEAEACVLKAGIFWLSNMNLVVMCP